MATTEQDVNTRRGILYVATGEKYVSEASKSALSCKKAMPGVPIALITDGSVKHDGEFDLIINCQTNAGSKKYKQNMFMSPFDKTIFLDTDTYVAKDILDIFEVLDHFDTVLYQSSSGYHYDLPGVPKCFSEFNTGMIAFRKNSEVENMFSLWNSLFDRYESEHGWTWDQHSFRKAVYDSGVRLAPVPVEYNFMPYSPAYFMGYVRVLHGRTYNRLVDIEKNVNARAGKRIFYPRVGTVRGSSKMSLGELARFWGSVTRLAVYEVLSRSLALAGLDRDWLLHTVKRAGRSGRP